ncbi:caspase-8 isoform X2 [Anguilla anguilla]|uniref:caspase-8 isoform X2 n=1 Tax=Anguilla anguilla TaxID=7936 RepID=UPI0015A81BA9|nr:caspase-8 isoform X2 [Anguilla anguilla]
MASEQAEGKIYGSGDMESFESRTNEQTPPMDFQQTLLKVEQSLNREDLQALVFLCADLLEKDARSISNGRDLFTQLQELDLLTPEEPSLLAELLRMSKRNGLLRQLGLSDLPPKGLVSPYRKLLFDLSENITAEDLKSIKFLLYNTLPRKKLDDDITMLSLLLEMEKEDFLSKTNLETLEHIIGQVRPSLRKKVIQFKEENGPVIQETGIPYASARLAQPVEFPSYIGDQMQPSQGASSYERPASFGCVQEHEDQYGLGGEELVPPSRFYIAQPHASSQEPCALPSHLSSILPASLDTPDARREGLSLSQFSSSGTTGSTFSSVQSHNVSFTSSCEEKNLSAAEPYPGRRQEIEAYAMEEDRSRGVCLIINNYDFSQSKLKDREGTDVDETCLVEVFQWLGFETRTKRDCDQQRMRTLLAQLSQEDHSRRDCVVCCVLSHGEQGVVYGVDGRALSLRELTEPFSGTRCATLREKPKLFFIQACQGRKEQLAVPVESNCLRFAQMDLATDAAVPRNSIPDDADFLLGMATVPDYASFRNKKEGTWFIQSLCENLVQLVPGGHDLLSILTKVNHHVSGMADGSGTRKQMPQPAYSLRKRVVFPVPRQPAPTLKLGTTA